MICFLSSGGYSRLQRKRDTIIGHLADLGFTGELAEKLLGADMITRRIYNQARNVAPGMVEMDRAAVLFNAVLASVKLNPVKYAQFISILQQIQGSRDLVDFIEGGLLYFRPTWYYTTEFIHAYNGAVYSV